MGTRVGKKAPVFFHDSLCYLSMDSIVKDTIPNFLVICNFNVAGMSQWLKNKEKIW